MADYLFTALFLILFLSTTAVAEEKDPSLIFQVSNEPLQQLPLSEMKSKLKVHRIEFFHPNYMNEKRK